MPVISLRNTEPQRHEMGSETPIGYDNPYDYRFELVIPPSTGIAAPVR